MDEGLLQPMISEAEMAKRFKQSVKDSVVMPDWVKDGILSNTQDFNFIEPQKILIEALITELEHNVMSSFRIE
jgi:hypothetical protein